MKKSRSKFKKVAFRLLFAASLLLVAAGILAVLLLFYSQTGHFEQKLASMIRERLEAALDRKVMIKEAALLIWGPEVHLKGFAVSDADGRFDRPFFKAEACRVKLNFLSLLKFKPEISKIVLSRPEIRLQFDERRKAPPSGAQSGRRRGRTGSVRIHPFHCP